MTVAVLSRLDVALSFIRRLILSIMEKQKSKAARIPSTARMYATIFCLRHFYLLFHLIIPVQTSPLH